MGRFFSRPGVLLAKQAVLSPLAPFVCSQPDRIVACTRAGSYRSALLLEAREEKTHTAKIQARGRIDPQLRASLSRLVACYR